jgi:hypothetical protein
MGIFLARDFLSPFLPLDCPLTKGTTGDTCNDFPEVCSIITPCINNGTCNDESGTAKCTIYVISC